MIKQINISNMDKLKEQMERALSDGYTHVIPYSNEIQIHQSMIKAITLPKTSFIVDYTINNYYLNDCKYFGLDFVDFEDCLTYRDKFFLNTIAYAHKQRIPFTRVPFNDHDSIRYYDSVLLSTKFKAPRWLVTLLRIIQLKHKEISYIYKKDSSKLKNHVVF